MWLAMELGDLAGAGRLARLLGESYTGRRDNATLYDRLHAALAAARAGDTELVEDLLRQTAALLREESGVPGPAETQPASTHASSAVEARTMALLREIETLVGDRAAEASYLLMLVAGSVFGLYSPDSLRLHRAVLARRPFDLGHLGIVAGGWAFEGNDQKLAQALAHGVALLPLRPCRTHTQWLPRAIISLARAGKMALALARARDYLSHLYPHEREAALREFVAAIPEARRAPGLGAGQRVVR
jgi:hypothetical protein